MSAVFADDWLAVHHGDARAVLADIEPDSIQCVVTSPPYWGLRDYGIEGTVWGGDPDHAHEWGERIVERAAGYEVNEKARWNHRHNGRVEPQERILAKEPGWTRKDVKRGAWCVCGAWCGALGLEPSPDLFTAHMVELFRAVRRVLRPNGTVWLNLGDSYASHDPAGHRDGEFLNPGRRPPLKAGRARNRSGIYRPDGLKPKDRMMMPARVALALQADGWWLRDEIVWAKSNPMPVSVRDRTTPAHEMVYLLTKRGRYYYDGDAIREPAIGSNHHDLTGTGYSAPGQTPQSGNRIKVPGGWEVDPGAHGTIHRNGRTPATYRERNRGGRDDGFTTMPGGEREWEEIGRPGRNKRSVWTIATQPYPEAHFATFPEKLVEPMILAGCPEGGTVLDPFAGSGTVALVAQRLGRKAILVEMSADYIAQAIKRIAAGRSAGEGPASDMPVPFRANGLWADAVG